MERRTYERPKVRDLGSLVDLTRATGFVDTEDGGMKLLVHHSAPAAP